MKLDDLPQAVRVGVQGHDPWVAQALARAVAGAVISRAWDVRPMRGTESADVMLLHAPGEGDWRALPPAVPAVALGGVSPPDTARPLALLEVAADAPRIAAAVAAVLTGLIVLDPARLADWPGRSDRSVFDGEPLTEREVQVLELIAKGMTNRDIGGLLGISAHTVKFHVAQVLDKLGAASRAEAVSCALRVGLIGL